VVLSNYEEFICYLFFQSFYALKAVPMVKPTELPRSSLGDGKGGVFLMRFGDRKINNCGGKGISVLLVEKTTDLSQVTNFITQCCIKYTLPSAGFELTTLIVINTTHAIWTCGNCHCTWDITSGLCIIAKKNTYYWNNKLYGYDKGFIVRNRLKAIYRARNWRVSVVAMDNIWLLGTL
jgi:hypothetical protein